MLIVLTIFPALIAIVAITVDLDQENLKSLIQEAIAVFFGLAFAANSRRFARV